ncbi:MAG: hypothetical protein QXO37_09440 [Candidatus Nitrosocaldaceae archaeon]
MANDREDGREGEEKGSKVRKEEDKAREEEVTSVKKELTELATNISKLAGKEIDELKQELSELFQLPPTSLLDPDVIRNWEELQNTLTPNVAQHIATKEQIELLNSALVANMFIFDYNIHKILAKLTSDKCSVEKLLKFITVKKIGVQLLQAKQNRLQALLSMLQTQANMYIAVVNAFNTAYAQIRSGLFDITQDLKWDAITATLIAALVAISLEIGRIKNDIRYEIARDEFCLQGCSPECVTMSMAMREGIHNANEGSKVEEVANKFLTMLEELAKVELDKAKKAIEERDYSKLESKE